MKFFHISDLHLGLRLDEYNLIEDQRHILQEIVAAAECEKPQAVLIAGDVYDKSLPTTDAVELLDDFLVSLAERGINVFIISGNHDSASRNAFGARLMSSRGVYIAPAYDGEVQRVQLMDEQGAVNIYMLPFIKPANVRRYFEDGDIDSYTDALRAVVESMNVDKTSRNILITHQFVTGAATCDSEQLTVGGSENVDVAVFDDFDYVALGHIHGPQSIGRETVRYCGTPLKYSFSEAGHTKSLTVVEMGEKGDTAVRLLPLKALHDLRKIRGSYMELTSRESYQNTDTDDYVHITLTDEQDIPSAVEKLRVIYPHLCRLDYDNTRTRTAAASFAVASDAASLSPFQLFEDLFYKQNGAPLTDEQKGILTDLIENIWQEEQL